MTSENSKVIKATDSPNSKSKFIILENEKFSTYSHLLGTILAIIGWIILLAFGHPTFRESLSISIYSISSVFLFVSSTVFHATKRKENEISFARKMDHIAIFIMIAGSYTPLCMFYLPNPWNIIILIAQWSMVILGIITKLIILNTPSWITISVYLFQGWMIVIALKPLSLAISTAQMILLFMGGILYSVGAIIYALQKPNPFPGIYGHHEIFHTLILIAAFLHFTVISFRFF